MRTAAYDLDVADCEVVVPSKVGAEMFVGNAVGVLIVTFLVVVLFLADFFVFVVAMVVLGDRGNTFPAKRTPAQIAPMAANFFMIDLSVISGCRRARASVTKSRVTNPDAARRGSVAGNWI